MSISVLDKASSVHFVGIGGVGLSAIARLCLLGKKQVTGSDQNRSPITDQLSRRGARIFFGHRAGHLPPAADLVIYSIAVPADNPELQAAQKRRLPLLSYPQALGLLSQDKFTIAVSGTHGKTTTTAMLAQIMIEAGFDPTVIVGSLVSGWDSNFRSGQSRYFLVEACEYRRSFLNLSPRILVVTNIDNDHLDYYRDLQEIKSAFADLAGKVTAGGRVITEKEYLRIKLPIKLKVPGAYNRKNAQAALAAALALGISRTVSLQALKKFKGTWRRFEYRGLTAKGARIYDDYAHHPAEIKAVLAAARELAGRGRIFAVFQPHLFSRTKILLNDFAKSFDDADQVMVTPIYAAREPVDPAVSGLQLAQALTKNGRPATYREKFYDLAAVIQERAGKGDLVVTLGAGNIFELAGSLVV